MKIIHVTASLSRLAAGISQSIWNFAREERALGHDVRLVGLRDNYTEQDIPADLGCPFRAARSIVLCSFGYSSDMASVLAEESAGADIIHAHGLWLYPGILACRRAHASGIPRMVSIHGMLEPWAYRHRAWKKRIAWRLFEHRNLRQAACLHATSEKEAANIRALGLTNPIAVIPLGIDPAPYRSPAPTPRIRKLLAETGGKRILLFLSRFHAVKGPDRLLEAWRQLAPRFPGWHLVLAGPDEQGYRAILEEQAQRVGVADRVTFTGPVYDADKYALLAAAELFVLPTHSENFGLVIVEALAAGLPVITTKGAPWADLVTHQCGWWVDSGAAPLATVLGEAMSLPPAALREMGLRGRSFVGARYAWPVLAGRMAETYEWLRRGGVRPAHMERMAGERLG